VACGLLTNFFVVVSLYLLYGVAVGLALPVKQPTSTPTSPRPNGPRSSRWTPCSRAAAACSGRRLGLGRAHALYRHGVGVERADTPPGHSLYWLARRRDRHLDTID